MAQNMNISEVLARFTELLDNMGGEDIARIYNENFACSEELKYLEDGNFVMIPDFERNNDPK